MYSTFRLTLLIALLWTAPSSGLSQTKPLELKWNEVGSIVAGHNIEAMLVDGAQVRGEAVAVREDALVMDIRKVSRTGAYQPGSGAIPRTAISLIKLERSRGGWGRTMGTIVGVLSGVVLGGWAAAHCDTAGKGIPTFLAISSGMSLGGYYLGRGLDKRTTLIRVVP